MLPSRQARIHARGQHAARPARLCHGGAGEPTTGYAGGAPESSRGPVAEAVRMGESPPTLEVIALTVADARAAERGGADRLEVVRAIEADGLTPAVEMVVLMRDCVRLPLRVMLRSNAGFA